MLYLLAIVCPPLAVLLCGRPFQALLSCALTLLLWLPGVVHAFAVVGSHAADRRHRELVAAVKGGRR